MPDNDLYNGMVVSRRVMVLFFLIDTSGSMDGTKIATVNDAIEGVIPELKRMSQGNDDAEIKIAVLTFSSGAEWITSALVSVESFCWNRVDAKGARDFGKTCEMLNEKLSRNAFMNESFGYYPPRIFLFTDGTPSDEYKQHLAKLKQNPWFERAVRIAMSIGDDCDDGILEEFTGSNETIFHCHTPELFVRIINFLLANFYHWPEAFSNDSDWSENPAGSDIIGQW